MSGIKRLSLIKPTRRVLLLTLAAFILAGLFPPWLYTFDLAADRETIGAHSEMGAGYALIFSPPSPQRRTPQSTLFEKANGIRLDHVRLLVEWLCIVAAGGAAWLMVDERNRNPAEPSQREKPRARQTLAAVAADNLPEDFEHTLFAETNRFLSDLFQPTDREAAADAVYPRVLRRAQHYFARNRNVKAFPLATVLDEEAARYTDQMR